MKTGNALGLIKSLVKYNLKIIFAGKFIWFFLAALGFFLFFLIEDAWNASDINEASIYYVMLFPGFLLVFYPVVFGIQNDEDNRILEILFTIPDYKYKVWGLRILMIYIATYFILVLFGYLATLLIFPVPAFAMAAQLMFPIVFMGNMAFFFSTITRSGNGTAILTIVLGVGFFIIGAGFHDSIWNFWLCPFYLPENLHPLIWESTILKNRLLLASVAILFSLGGLLNLQKREKFV